MKGLKMRRMKRQAYLAVKGIIADLEAEGVPYDQAKDAALFWLSEHLKEAAKQ